MYLGKLMEVSPAEELYDKPIHPYTSALLGAIPIPDPQENRARERPIVAGEPPNPIDPPTGCRFHTRCPRATDICRRGRAAADRVCGRPPGRLPPPAERDAAGDRRGNALGGLSAQRRRGVARRRRAARRLTTITAAAVTTATIPTISAGSSDEPPPPVVAACGLTTWI